MSAWQKFASPEIEVGPMDALNMLDRLIAVGLPELCGQPVSDLKALARTAHDQTIASESRARRSFLAIHPSLVPASRLAPMLNRAGKPGFVVADMIDLDDFTATEQAPIPDHPLYLVHDAQRGDDLRNLTPDEATAEIKSRGRSPLTINEGISWLLLAPDMLAPGSCFMTPGSRLGAHPKPDPRVPAIWISGGTGRDGAHRKGAPKVGWCWARNRHTWLGHASTASRGPGR